MIRVCDINRVKRPRTVKSSNSGQFCTVSNSSVTWERGFKLTDLNVHITSFSIIILCFIHISTGHRAHPPAGGWEPGRQGQLHEGCDRWQVGPLCRVEGGHADIHIAPRGQQPQPAVEEGVWGMRVWEMSQSVVCSVSKVSCFSIFFFVHKV